MQTTLCRGLRKTRITEYYVIR